MVSDQTRNMVWQEFLDVARLVRYYEALSNRYRLSYYIVRFLLLASAVSGIAVLLELLPATLQSISNGLIALLVVWDFLSDYARKAEVLRTISLHCSELESQWRDLWIELDDVESSDIEIRRKNGQLSERISVVTDWAGLADVRDDQKLNSACEREAYQVMFDCYTHPLCLTLLEGEHDAK